MKTWKQRLIAALCCVVLLVTSLYVTEPQNAEAAEATSTMSLNIASVNYVLGWNPKGYLNIPYTGVASDYSGSGSHFLNNAFIESYITFGGGMTAADLLEGVSTFYVANNSILQLNWGNRTTAFTPGWSFTIANGALLPYRTASGTAYMALDKEYTFTFAAGSGNYTNLVKLSAVNTTTFSMPTGQVHATGKSATSATPFNITGTDITSSSIKTQYTYLQADAQYADYIDFNGTAFSALADKSVKIRTIFDGNTKCIQVETWGDLRTDFKVGYQVVFRKGMPLYYTDSNGNAWKALLDGTYVYEGMYSDASHDLVFSGAKIDENASIALNTKTYTSAETYVNIGFVQSSSVTDPTHSVEEDFLADYITGQYIELSGCSVDLRANGVTFKYIPKADTIQLAFGAAAKALLKAGDTIVFKAGMPIVYNTKSNHAAACVVLDDEYTFRVVSNDGTTLVMSCEITGSYSLSGNVSGRAAEGDPSCFYYNFYLGDDTVWSDSNAKFQGNFSDNTEILQNYFMTSVATTSETVSEGWFLRRYNLDALKGLRFYCPESSWDFGTGDYVIFREGLPVSYTTTSGKAKTTYLDKDYGFVYDADTNKFTYDATLSTESLAEKFEITTTQSTTFYETNAYKMNVAYTSTKEAATTQATQNILKSTGEAGNTADYVDFCGLDSATIDELGISIKLYPSEPCFQIVWGTKALDWIAVGDTLSFKEGMPVYYATGDVMLLSKTMSYTVSEVSANSFTMVQYAESGSYALDHTQIGTGKSSEANALIHIVNAETGASDALNDAQTTYARFEAEIITRYIDFCGLTAEELETCGTWMQAIRNGETQVLQINWGTVTEKMAIGEQVIFYEGLPITYKTTEGLTKTVYLDKTVTFTVAAGNTGNTYTLNYTKPEVIGSWGINSGAAYIVSGSETGAEGYFNNINLLSSELTDEVTAVRYTLTDDELEKYVDFAGLKAATYGFKAIVIIDGDTKVVQLRWGSTTSAVKDGDHIVFKEGLPIQATTTSGQTKKFVLDADYTFTIQKYGNGQNGYRITGVQEIEASATPGDVDADYLLDKNDITLLKKELIDIISVADSDHADANADGKVNSVDLVHALKSWNVDEQEAYTTIYENLSAVKIAAGNTYTATLNQALGTVNYLRLTFDTTENMYGTFYYTYNGKEYQENFYLAEDEVQFEQFLDNYRTNGVLGTTAATSKTLTKISFTNVGDAEATFLLNKVEKADRAFENSDMLYAQNNDIKIGVDLNMGGSLAYYESLRFAPVEYANNSKRTVHIEPKADYSKSSSYIGVIENVNLVNIYDLGRQIQQSFYIDVQDSDYTRGTYNNNSAWPYNPVQAGDKNNNKSQIVDYRKIDTDGDGMADMIYVKTRAMDWSNPGDVQGGRTTESYMENWYKLSDNLLYVDNAFVDWAGWEDCGSQSSQELPAFYTGQALNYFVAGNDISKRYGTLGPWNGTGQSYHVDKEETSNWYAWVNADSDNAFGLGIYIPNADACTAGRCVTTNQYSRYSWLESGGSLKNRNAGDALIFDLGFDYLSAKTIYQNCYLYNTSYIAPTKVTVLREYTSYEYTYVLTADRLSGMASIFDTLDENNMVTNEAMNTW